MLPPPEKSTVFMGVVRANSRNIFEVEDNSVKTILFVRMQQLVPESAVQES